MTEDSHESSGSNITLVDAVMAAIRKNTIGLFVHLPGVVQSYDPATQTISVQPSIDRALDDGTIVKLPILDDVPIVYPRALAGGLSFPLAEGDQVLLCFSQRSLDKWKDQGAGFAPNDNRLFDISDALAIPGAYPITAPLDPPPEGLDLRGENINYKAVKNFSIKAGEALTLEGKTVSIKALDGPTTIESSEKVDIKADAVNLGASPSDPAVLGSVLQTNLEDLIQAIDDLISALTTTATVASGPIQVFTAGSAASQTGFGAVLPPIVAPVQAALAAVKTALPNENSGVVQLE